MLRVTAEQVPPHAMPRQRVPSRLLSKGEGEGKPGRMDTEDGVPGSVPLDAEELQRLRYTRPEVRREPAQPPEAAFPIRSAMLPPVYQRQLLPENSLTFATEADEVAGAPSQARSHLGAASNGEGDEGALLNQKDSVARNVQVPECTESDILFARIPLARTGSSTSDTSSISQEQNGDGTEEEPTGVEQDSPTPEPTKRKITLRNVANAIRLGSILGSSSSKESMVSPAKATVAVNKFQPSKALQRAANRLTVARVFNSHLLASVKYDVLGKSNQNKQTVHVLKEILSSDKDTKALLDLSYDPRKLGQMVTEIAKEQKQIEARKEKEERQRQSRSKRERLSKTKPEPQTTFRGDTNGSVAEDIIHVHKGNSTSTLEEEERKKMLGFGMNQEDFMKFISEQDSFSANQTVVARLMQIVAEHTKLEEAQTQISWMRCYKCIDPDSVFISCWTVVYVLLIIYICTVGLLVNTFDLDAPDEGCTWSFYNWFDLAIDTFFVIDVLCRCFLFGISVESVLVGGESSVVTAPDLVLKHYVNGGMSVDVVTAFPVQWVIMVVFTPCESSGNITVLRLLRVFRVSRIFKLFKQPLVLKWMKMLRRHVGNYNLIQIWTHITAVLLFNHVWTCFSRMIQGLDTGDDNGDGRTGFEEWKDLLHVPENIDWFTEYTILFNITLQHIFAIEPYPADQIVEGWFGVLTLAMAIFINATMLSKILEIWTAINKAQNDMDHRLCSVQSFLKSNGIRGDLCDDILDYFEFRYNTTTDLDNDKVLLDHLPTEMQSRVTRRIFPHALNNSYLFTGANEAFVAQCVLRMSRNSLQTMPGQVITAQGTLGSEMFFLKTGTADVRVSEGGVATIVSKIYPGQCFGDISLWMESRRSATVFAADFCHLFILNKADFEDVVNSFPEMMPQLATHAIASVLRVKNMSPALAGISTKTAERLGRRMAANSVVFQKDQLICEQGKSGNAKSNKAQFAYVLRAGKVCVFVCVERACTHAHLHAYTCMDDVYIRAYMHIFEYL
jgi:voltage-gated potassium channel